jgi:hypothetical protein
MLTCFLCVCTYLTENTAANFTVATYQPRKEQVTEANHFNMYEGYTKINLLLVGKNKCVVIVSKRTLSNNK